MEDIQQNRPMMEAPQKKSFGALIGIIIILIVLVLGGLYIYGKSVGPKTATPLEVLEAQSDAADLNALSTQGPSDTPEDIGEDLQVNVTVGAETDLQNL